MEPSHTVHSNTPTHTPTKSNNAPRGRWDFDDHRNKKKRGTDMKEEGLVLLISDPSGQFNEGRKYPSSVKPKEELSSGDKDIAIAEIDGSTRDKETDQKSETTATEKSTAFHVKYQTGSVASSRGAFDNPHRGDLVSFTKGKNAVAKDVRIIKKADATIVKGRLHKVNREKGTALFEVEGGVDFPLDLTEVVSCDVKLLQDGTTVEGIQHEGSIYGVCRVTDLYLVTKIYGAGRKERTSLNLTVKKELQGLGGKIVAQSGLAKGPDGTIGFVKGWTNRQSHFAQGEVHFAQPEVEVKESENAEEIEDVKESENNVETEETE